MIFNPINNSELVNYENEIHIWKERYKSKQLIIIHKQGLHE